MRHAPPNDRVGRIWSRRILAVIVVGGMVLSAMILTHPYGSSPWVWASALVLYVPFVLVGAAILKYLMVLARRPHRPN